jgi:serine/threonine protein kinase/Tol biopolymer transport system component
LIGTTVSHYEILEPLGSGGMGLVYKARDTRLDRLVALKVLSPQRAGEADRRRFVREAKAASSLDHPNVCALYDFGETDDGRLFLAMAFCEGETLRDRIDRGPLPPAEAADIAAQVAAALAAAHERGIVHRDVKPGNIMVSPAGRVKLVDFGIARSVDQSRLTRAGTVVGTASYMAPELFRGEPADHRADIWSLGVVLFEMLTGELPFDGRDGNELIQALLQRPPRPVRAFVSGVPPALQKIVDRALAKSPAERYTHIGEMRWALETALDETEGAGETVVDLPRRASRPGAPGAPGDGERTARMPSASTLTGTTISRYEVLEPIGGGGMGVVYKALDTRLGRTVALKFLPPELTRDPEAKERFLLEARTASALDHPNVCTIHEIGETDEDQLYLAMACYDGETLRRRIERGPLPLDEATDVAKQVAQGLAKAHRQGIVHRDVKPANVMLTADGVVKILDFGLAKLAGTASLTRLGTSLGTPAYMSPEQARGEEVDARTDVWSLGVLLYEMIAGRRPFPGDNDQAVLYGLLNETPKPLSSLRVDVPSELERIVTRMLAKDPAERYPSMAEVIADLRKLRNEPSTGTLQMQSASMPARRGKSRKLAVLAAAAAVAVLAAAGWWLLARDGRSASGGPVQATFSRLTDQEGSESFPSLSPDGTFFVYAKTVEGDTDVYLQRVGGGNPINLTEDSDAVDTQPAYSPDGQQIAFRSDRGGGGIFLMGATGESVRRLTDFGYNPSWSPDGKELVVATEGIASPGARSNTSQLWKIDVASGGKSLLVEGDAAQPSWSPNGHRIAFWGVPPGSAQRVLWTVPAAGGEPVRITDDLHLNWSPVWSPDGRHLYFASDRGGTMNLWRVPIDERSGETRGEPEPITTPAPWSGLLSFSRDGRQIVYATDEGKSNLEKIAFDPAGATVSGEPRAVTQGSRAVRIGEVSPDGRWIAFDTSAPREDLFVVQADGGGLRQLTDDDFKDRVPRWSPDGSRILFYSNRSGQYEAWTIRPDGSGLEQLTRTGESLFSPIWSPDGRRIVATRGFEGAVLIDLTQPIERRTPTPLPVDREAAFNASSWSPDGKRLAGNLETPGIVVYSFDSRALERLSDRGRSPLWLRDNRTILYLDEDGIFALDSRTRRTWPVVSPPSNSVFLGLSVSPDHRTLYTVRAFDEGDIWMATIR